MPIKKKLKQLKKITFYPRRERFGVLDEGGKLESFQTLPQAARRYADLVNQAGCVVGHSIVRFEILSTKHPPRIKGARMWYGSIKLSMRDVMVPAQARKAMR